MKLFKYIYNQILNRKKRELLNYLQSMPVDRIEQLGFCATLVQQGISAWPWQATSDTANRYTQLQYLKQLKPQASLHVNAPFTKPAFSIEQGSVNVQVAENKQIDNSAIDLALELEQESKVQRSAA